MDLNEEIETKDMYCIYYVLLAIYFLYIFRSNSRASMTNYETKSEQGLNIEKTEGLNMSLRFKI